MDDWLEVWDRKGNTETKDLRWLNGYEDTQADGQEIVQKIIDILGIRLHHHILEVGCGAGYLTQYMENHCLYHGIDRSTSLLLKNVVLSARPRFVSKGEADNLKYASDFFNHVYCQGVFHYFPDMDYAARAIKEMLRVSIGSIFIGDLPIRSHRDSHLLYDPDMFKGCEISKGLYEPHSENRFNVLIPKGWSVCL